MGCPRLLKPSEINIAIRDSLDFGNQQVRKSVLQIKKTCLNCNQQKWIRVRGARESYFTGLCHACRCVMPRDERSLMPAAARIGISHKKYIENRKKGLKWCTLGQHWTTRNDFSKNAAHRDGLATSCREHKRQSSAKGPSRLQKEKKAILKQKWCSGCEQWLPEKQVLQSRCRQCLNAYERNHYATNRAYRQERKYRVHARKRNCDKITPEVQDAAMQGTGGLCRYCDSLANTFDHVIPITKGGNSKLENIVPACASCNSSKKDWDLDVWLKKTGRYNEYYKN